MTILELLLCWLNRPRQRPHVVVDNEDGVLLDLACTHCGMDHR